MAGWERDLWHEQQVQKRQLRIVYKRDTKKWRALRRMGPRLRIRAGQWWLMRGDFNSREEARAAERAKLKAAEERVAFYEDYFATSRPAPVLRIYMRNGEIFEPPEVMAP